MEPNTERLRRILSRSEYDLNLAEAALLIASDEYPELDVSAYLRRLDELAASVRRELSDRPGLEETIVALNRVLFTEQGFSGNTDDYYDPRNSFLNDVLDRRLGIPITLSIVYMEIGQRLGLSFEGVSFPGHFLVKHPTDEGDLVLDPFSGGVPLDEDDLMELLEKVFGHPAAASTPVAPLLNAAGKKEILVRVLRNLKAIYLHRQQLDKALHTVDRILLIAPDLPEEVHDRGKLYDQLECFRPALDDYRRFLVLQPQSDSAQTVRVRVTELQRLIAHIS